MAGSYARVELFARRSIFGRKSYYWRLVAANNRIVAIPGEGFTTEAKAEDNYNLARTMLHPSEDLPVERA